MFSDFRKPQNIKFTKVTLNAPNVWRFLSSINLLREGLLFIRKLREWRGNGAEMNRFCTLSRTCSLIAVNSTRESVVGFVEQH